jgi:protein tyrosine phosphatase (PTP) superfamily phosphohydrolase (DUF442 family)
MVQPAQTRRRQAVLVLAAVLVMLHAGAFAESQQPVPPLGAMASVPALLINERHPLPGMLTGGAPVGERAAPGLRALAAAGARTLIDLRTDAEVAPETATLAAAAGLDYRRLPIAGEADLDLANVRALDGLLAEWGRYPIALACSSGNRVGALLALRAFWLDGADAAAALELGRSGGLTRLEPAVRQLLGLPPMAVPAAAGSLPPAADGSAPPPVPPQQPN